MGGAALDKPRLANRCTPSNYLLLSMFYIVLGGAADLDARTGLRELEGDEKRRCSPHSKGAAK